jgi:hypothetical protein
MRWILLPIAVAGALALGGCARHYAAEGALGGAAVGAIIGADRGDAAEGAAIGAAAGGAIGALIRKNGRCYRIDRYGRERRVRC